MMGPWFTFEELCSHWKMNKHNLTEVVLDGKLTGYFPDDFSSLYIDNEQAYYQDRQGYTVGSSPILPTAEKISQLIFRHFDVKELENKYGTPPHRLFSGPSELDITERHEVVGNTTSPQKRPDQECREKAIEIAVQYIKDCETGKKFPVITECVMMVKREYTKEQYKDNTIHNWIKDLFPEESRKPGRKPRWRDRQGKNQ